MGLFDINIAFQPLYDSDKRYFFITGGRGSLKSHSLHDYILKLTYQKNHGILFTRWTMTSARDSIIPEFKEAILSRKEEDISEELGDILFVLVNIAKFNKIDAEEALRNTNNKFITRFQHIEVEVTKRGKTLKETPLEELEQYWQDAKGDKSSS